MLKRRNVKQHKSLLIMVSGLATAALLILLNDLFLYESILVPSSSMMPTLFPNERVFLHKLGHGEFRRFDVVVVNSPYLGHRIVKRIIGLPGDCIQLKDSWRVVINGQEMDYQQDPSNGAFRMEARHHRIQLKRDPRYEFQTKFGASAFCLKSDEYYLLGDNRLASKDSRVFGPTRLSEIQGKMIKVWYSYDRSSGRVRAERLWATIQ